MDDLNPCMYSTQWGLDNIIFPNDDGIWTDKTTQSEIVTGLLKENEKQSTQAKTTPLTVFPLKEDAGCWKQDQNLNYCWRGPTCHLHQLITLLLQSCNRL